MGAGAEHEVRSRAPAVGRTQRLAGRSPAIDTVVVLAVTAGVIHAAAMLTHFGKWWVYGVFFLVVMFAQIAWAAWLYRHPADRPALVYGAIVNLAIVGVWVVTRTVGLPFGPDAWHPEQVGGMDVMASLDQLVIAGLIATIAAPRGRIGLRLRWMAGTHAVRLRSMLCSASFFAIVVGGHH